jgi:hypothetical protein
MALASLALGISSFALFGLVASVPGVVVGHMAQFNAWRHPEGSESGGSESGGMTLAGLALCYGNILSTLF